MEKITYTLSLPNPVQHLLDVTVELDARGLDAIDLVMPAWTPGSYLLREYARHVQDFHARVDGRPASWRKVAKGTWRIDTRGADTVIAQYRVYGYELTVRTNHVDGGHAHVIPAATFMYVDGCQNQAVRVVVEPPPGWSIATGLNWEGGASDPSVPWPGAGAASFTAEDFDHLVDSPFEIGTHRLLAFEVDAKPHRIVVWGHGNEDDARLVRDARRIVEAQRSFWGGLPYEHYTFFLLLGGKTASGGLEHRNSTSLLLPRFIFRPAKSYERYLSLVSHEFFHTWNVKRLRAEGLGPFDYTRELYTTLLWAMEGITEYYTDLLLVRAGLFTPERYLERLADDIVQLQTTPGRKVRSLECASFDAWIKFYRPDENTVNTSISYYLKGALVALLLDLELRTRTAGQASLDTVMRWLYKRYPSTGPGVPPEGYREAIRAVANLDLDTFWERYIAGTEELPFADAFAQIGVAMEWSHKHKRDGGDEGRPELGIRTKNEQGFVRITNVLSDGPAASAGLAADDELVALDGFRVSDESSLGERLAERQAGDTVQLTVFRREELLTIAVPLAHPVPNKLKLTYAMTATDEQRALREAWLLPQ